MMESDAEHPGGQIWKRKHSPCYLTVLACLANPTHTTQLLMARTFSMPRDPFERSQFHFGPALSQRFRWSFR